MSDQSALLAPFLERREKNLAFMAHRFPDLFRFFKDYKFKAIKLDILPELNETNIIRDGKHLYTVGARKHAALEIEEFKKVFSEGTHLRSVFPSYAGEYKHKRFFHQAMDNLIRESSLSKEKFQHYRLGNFYPLIVFLGCGLGYQIEQMILNENVHNAVIVEPDLDNFAASLYSVDWEAICSQYNLEQGRTIDFVLGGQNDEYMIWAMTWNNLIKKYPQFPINVLYYNHMGQALFDRVIQKTNQDLPVYLTTWGDYDDEIRQLNYSMHNIMQGVKELPHPFKTPSKTAVLIIGSGPSLDDRIDSIKKVREKVIIISCGTALKTLAYYDLKPDIHVELESDLLAFVNVLKAAPEDYYKDVKLIGPSHINPLIYRLFKQSRMYYKKESVSAPFFGEHSGHIIEDATPTCTNLALTLSIKMGFKRIFLFGLDCGFTDKERHHSKGSRYYENGAGNPAKDKNLTQIKTVNGETAWSSPIYFATKRRIENTIKHHAADKMLKVYSCSDVAVIEETKWLSQKKFDSTVRKCNDGKEQDMDYLFNPNAKQCDLEKAQASIHEAYLGLKKLGPELKEIVGSTPPNLEAFSLLCTRLNDFIERKLIPQNKNVAMLIQGSVKHFLYNGTTHAFAIFDEAERAAFLTAWMEHFLNFFAKVPEHFHSVVFKDFDIETDLWIKQSIKDPENGMSDFFTGNKKENLDLMAMVSSK